MIELQQGDILKAKADALVNTVNCVGVMGRGIALQFRKAFPEVFKAYEAACKRGELEPGKVLSHDSESLRAAATTSSTYQPRSTGAARARMEYIEAGLDALMRGGSTLGHQVHCGTATRLRSRWSGLARSASCASNRTFEALPDVRVLLFEPKGAPSAEEMAKRAENDPT